MKAKMILGLVAALMFGYTSLAQKGEKKKDWNPEKKVATQVERFSKQNELTKEQAEALKTAITDHYKEMKAVREAELQRKKKMHKELQEKKNEKIQDALNDKELSEAWKVFEHKERQKMKKKHQEMKVKRKKKNGLRFKKRYQKQQI